MPDFGKTPMLPELVSEREYMELSNEAMSEALFSEVIHKKLSINMISGIVSESSTQIRLG